MEFVISPVDIYKLIEFIIIITTNITTNISQSFYPMTDNKWNCVSPHIGYRLECDVSWCLLTLEQKTHQKNQKKNQLKNRKVS